MNKTNLIDAVASKSGLAKTDAAKAVDAFVGAVKESLAGGEKITLVGFGTFDVTERAGRNGRNPRTGQVIEIPSKKVVKFKPAKGLL